jgi:hypothetical protein
MQNRFSATIAAGTIGLLAIAAPHARAQTISITSTGADVYDQNFDTLADSAVTTVPFSSGTTINGFYAQYDTPSASSTTPTYNAATSYRVSDGTNTGSSGFYSLGNATDMSSGAATERAFGAQAGGSTYGAVTYGFEFVNNIPNTTITGFTLSYSGEQWNSVNANAQTLQFAYSTTATNIGKDTYTKSGTSSGNTVIVDPAYSLDSSLNFTTAINDALGTNSGVTNGNTDAQAIADTISGLDIAPGGVLWIRWIDKDDSGSDDQIGIDNVSLGVSGSVTAAPEPSGVASMLIGFGLLGIFAARRRRAAV